ncbi:hormone-sensitive lipase-like isoform X2 [Homarus americanus]|uniref:hormone-sensitive lipase-like isoform X2 n=1 Tax=Homarus americanus TaxID=6706 RepID=UPI001C443376|nr:hormone-sensitive lipase-like isoform X2 [Homarus americanus]
MADNVGMEESSTPPVVGSTDPCQSILPTVLHMIEDNTANFKNDDSEYGQRLHSGFVLLKENMDKVIELSESVRKEVHLYDFDAETPGNGFRSFNNIVQQAILSVFDLCKQICTGRDSLLFRKGHFVREVEAWGQTLASLVVLLEYIENMLLPRCEDGNLLSGISSSPNELMSMLNSVPQYSFYGRCLGFHYYPSLRKTLKYLNICLSAFSEVYYADGNSFMQRTKNTVMSSSRYVVDAELRSRRIVDVVQYSSVEFIKAFWSVAETDFMTQLPGIVGPSLAVQQVVIVPCEEQQVTKMDGTATVVVPPPHSHIEARPITCHLLSTQLREGMVGGKPGEKDHKGASVLPPSDCLLIHCHGGGFVTQSTKAQEVFLREWAVSVGVPILSIDYSLAPEAPYPRPLEEVLTVYCWVLNNMNLLGSTGSKIIMTGDSAGGNLIAGLTIKCLELGIRPADGLFFAYTPFVFELVPSPARLLAVMDPMLPLGFALRCLKAYAGVSSGQTSRVTSPGDITLPTLSSQTSRVSTNSEYTDAAIDNTPVSLNIPQTKSGVSDPQSDTESFVEVSESDVKEAEALVKSPSFLSDPGSDTLTTVSLTSEASKLEDSSIKNSNGSGNQKPREKEERSRRYVTEFLEKYVLDSRTDKQGRRVPILRTGSEESEQEDETVLFEAPSVGAGITAKLGRAKDAVVSGISAGLTSFGLKRKESVSSPTSPVKPPPATTAAKRPSLGQILMGKSPSRKNSRCSLMEEFSGVEIISDHYLSPLTAPKEILAKFPPCAILTVEYDFCLDDDVTMAKTLKSLGVPVTIDILERLPHGFLSLSLVSQEAHNGCKKAIECIKQLLSKEDTEQHLLAMSG